MKCSKCGTEFEGNFCPNCGAKAEEKVLECPVCGATRECNADFCKNCGYNFNKTNSKFSIKIIFSKIGNFIKIHKKLLLIILLSAIILTGAIIGTVLIVKGVNNKFKISKVSQIEYGMTKEQVKNILGEPFEIENKSIESNCFEYFSDNFINIYNKCKNGMDEDLNGVQTFGDYLRLIKKYQDLSKELETMQFSYIQVSFDLDNKVEKVILDKAHIENDDIEADKKILKNTEYIGKKYNVDLYQAEYNDGSYIMSYLGDILKKEISEDGNKIKEFYQNEWGDFYILCNPTGFVLENFTIKSVSKSIESLVIMDGICAIDEYAFQNCESLISVKIPKSIKSIGKYAFKNCNSLTDVVFEQADDWKAGNVTLLSDEIENSKLIASYLTKESFYLGNTWIKVN